MAHRTALRGPKLSESSFVTLTRIAAAPSSRFLPFPLVVSPMFPSGEEVEIRVNAGVDGGDQKHSLVGPLL